MEHSPGQRTTKGTAAGSCDLLGAEVVDTGVNFALNAPNAEQVQLILFDEPGGSPTDTIDLRKDETTGIWHVLVQGLKPGQLYGYRAAGPYDPERGFRFNHHKLLMDPYAKALTGKFVDRDGLLYGYDHHSPLGDLSMDRRDNARVVPKCIVMGNEFDWDADRRPAVPHEEMIIYEAHVRGFTAHPASGVECPGTFAGFAEKAPYLKKLGITTVELMPVHEFHIRGELVDRGLTEYWGYNTAGFFAPESSYSTGTSPGCQVREFKTMVRELHRMNIEVILDVVYNHTGEEGELGPTLCFRGIDNGSYYVLDGPETQPGRFYRDLTGCRNTLDIEKPPVLRLVLDSLRYWVQEMHVDGFRFDLATVLGMRNGVFDPDADFFRALREEPAFQGIKLIAEPWDMTTRQTGKFPRGWMEWNDSSRDGTRRFLRGDEGRIGDFARVLAGSQDLFEGRERGPCSSVNFITAHDGFTLRDLYTYERKRNEKNGEHNRDGSDHNHGFNCGVEGETGDAGVNALRRRMVRNGLCALLLSRGIPMLLSGDEVFRTRNGNNNAYCQDNELTWFPWNQVPQNQDLLTFCRDLIATRKRFPALRQCAFFTGESSGENTDPDIRWYGPDLGRPDWSSRKARLLCCEIAIGGSAKGARTAISHLFMIYNMGSDEARVQLPSREGLTWRLIHDTACEGGTEPSGENPLPESQLRDIRPAGGAKIPGREPVITVTGRAVAVLAGITCSV
jgi:isoamylase